MVRPQAILGLIEAPNLLMRLALEHLMRTRKSLHRRRRGQSLTNP